MNRYAMQHIMDSSFCFPISENEIEIRLQTARDDMKWVELIYESKYVFGMTQKRARMNRAYSSELFDYYTIRLQLEDTRAAFSQRMALPEIMTIRRASIISFNTLILTGRILWKK